MNLTHFKYKYLLEIYLKHKLIVNDKLNLRY